MGRLVAQYDVLNHIIVKLGIYPINKSELAITYDWVESLIDNRT